MISFLLYCFLHNQVGRQGFRWHGHLSSSFALKIQEIMASTTRGYRLWKENISFNLAPYSHLFKLRFDQHTAVLGIWIPWCGHVKINRINIYQMSTSSTIYASNPIKVKRLTLLQKYACHEKKSGRQAGFISLRLSFPILFYSICQCNILEKCKFCV